MILLTLKLLLAHVLGDFVFQPDAMVEHKRSKKHKSPFFYLHLAIHMLALLLVLRFDGSYWFLILVIVGSHCLIDLLKLHLDGRGDARLLFAGDQLLHLTVIGCLVAIYQPFSINIEVMYSPQILMLVLALFGVTFVSGVVMKLVMSSWAVDEVNTEDSLKNAGKYIGILERLFVFAFVVLNLWQAIGLLIAAKSVFRFGDLSRAKDRKLTEYILIGTLLSFGMALLMGLAYRYVLDVNWA